MLVIIIIGKHQLGFVIPKLGADKLVVDIPDRNAHFFHIEQGIITFPACNVTGHTVSQFAVGITPEFFVFLYHLLGRNRTTRIGTSGMPVVDSAPGTTASFYRPLVDNDDLCPSLYGTDSGVASGNSATKDQNIGVDIVFLTVTYRIWPLGNRCILLNVFVPGAHFFLLLQLILRMSLS